MSTWGFTSSRVVTAIRQARADVLDLARMDPGSELLTDLSESLHKADVLVRRLRAQSRDPGALLRYRSMDSLVDPPGEPCPSHVVEMNGVQVATDLLSASTLYACGSCGKLGAGPTWQYLGTVCARCHWPVVQRITCSNQCRR